MGLVCIGNNNSNRLDLVFDTKYPLPLPPVAQASLPFRNQCKMLQIAAITETAPADSGLPVRNCEYRYICFRKQRYIYIPHLVPSLSNPHLFPHL